MSTCHIRSGTLVCMDPAGTVVRGDLLVRDATIAAVGKAVALALAALPGGRADTVIDAAGALVLPGFVHGHLHLCQTLFRGLAEEADLLCWLRESIWPLEATHTEASVAASARLGLVELIASGVTCINDMGTVHHTEAIGMALEAAGIRAVFGKALMDQGEGVPPGLAETSRAALDDALQVARHFDGAAQGRLRVSLAPRFILTCSEPLWREVAALSRERGFLVHTHLAESPSEAAAVMAAVGTSAARYFDQRGVLSERFVGAHGVWLEADELARLAATRAALVHCPGSNLKLGAGIAKVRAWCDAGVRAGLGSDGAGCNNRLDVFHEMSLAASLSRIAGMAPAGAPSASSKIAVTPPAAGAAPGSARHSALGAVAPLTPREVVELATIRGADALGLAGAIGSLEVGKQADLAVIDVAGAHHAPHHDRDPYVTLVHAARPTDVQLTMVAGRILYRDGAWTTLDPERVVGDARAEAMGLLARASR